MSFTNIAANRRATIMIRIDEETKKYFKKVCKELDVKQSDVVRDAMFRFIIEHKHLLERDDD